MWFHLPMRKTFLSTPSARRATESGITDLGAHKFLSTPSARRATEWIADLKKFAIISIHALREEGDLLFGRGRNIALHISIHALREEGDSKNGEKHLRFCFIIKRSAQIWKSFSKNIRKKSRDLHRMP